MLSFSPLSGIEKLAPDHDPSDFDCGNVALIDWLQRFALQSQRGDSCVTYLVHRSLKVCGYYSLTLGSVECSKVPIRYSKGLGQYPIPVVIIARLGVDKKEQGTGLGKALLKDALKRILSVGETVPVRAVVVHAKDETAKMFYEHYDFEPSPVDAFHMMLLMKDLKSNVGQ